MTHEGAAVAEQYSQYSLTDLTTSLLIGSLVLLVAVAAVRISVRSGVPALLLFRRTA